MNLENHAEGKNPIVNVLSMRDFRLLFAGVSTSFLGNQFTLIATSWLVLQLASDPLALADRLTAREKKRVTIVGSHSQDRRLWRVDDGLVYGRNIYQHPNPALITRAFMAMIHEQATAEEAWDIYQSGSVA